jgi:hypothetical protein
MGKSFKNTTGAKAKRPQVPQLNVRPFPDELLRRISAVAGASGKTQKEFVIEALDERTKEYKESVEGIYSRERNRSAKTKPT